MRWTIEATIITSGPEGSALTETVEAEVEAPSFPAACRIVREANSSEFVSVFIDVKQRQVAA